MYERVSWLARETHAETVNRAKLPLVDLMAIEIPNKVGNFSEASQESLTNRLRFTNLTSSMMSLFSSTGNISLTGSMEDFFVASAATIAVCVVVFFYTLAYIFLFRVNIHDLLASRVLYFRLFD